MGEQIRRCVIVGAAVFENAMFLKHFLCEDDYVIAADGGLRLLNAMGVVPHAIIGDFDSSPCPDGVDVPVRCLPTHKDDTDVFAAAKEALALGYREFLLLGCLGGRLDHTLSNLFLLRFLHENNAHGLLVDEHHEVSLLTSGEHTVSCRNNCYFSLLPFGGDARGVTIRGAEYPLENATLDTVFPLGVSNGFLSSDVTVSLQDGCLLLILAQKDGVTSF